LTIVTVLTTKESDSQEAVADAKGTSADGSDMLAKNEGELMTDDETKARLTKQVLNRQTKMAKK